MHAGMRQLGLGEVASVMAILLIGGGAVSVGGSAASAAADPVLPASATPITSFASGESAPDALPPGLDAALERDLGLTVEDYLHLSEQATDLGDLAVTVQEAGAEVTGTALKDGASIIFVADEASAEIVGAESADVEVVVGAPSVPELDLSDVVPASSLSGGDPIGYSEGGGSYRCSTGAAGVDPATGERRVLTAGHCQADVGSIYRVLTASTPGSISNPTPSIPIGAALPGAFRFGAGFDTGLIAVSNATLELRPEVTTWGGGSGAPASSPPLAVRDAAPAVVGAPVCKSGATSGWTCGTIVDVDRTVDVGGTFVDLTVTTMCVLQGDSGGAVVSGATFVGLVSATSFDGSCDPGSTANTGRTLYGLYFTYATPNVSAASVTAAYGSAWEPLIAVRQPTVSGARVSSSPSGARLTVSGALADASPRHRIELRQNGVTFAAVPVAVDGTWTSESIAPPVVDRAIEVVALWGAASRSVGTVVTPTQGDARTGVLAQTASGGLVLYPGDGRGSWQSPTTLAASGSARPMTVSPDLDGDGGRDVLQVTNDGRLSIRSLVSGVLQSARLVAAPEWATATALIPVGDFSGDGRNDLLSRTPSGDLLLHAGDGAGGFAASRRIGNGWGSLDQLFGAGDFDGDAHPDVIGRASNGNLMLYAGNGRGGWKSGSAVGFGWGGFTAIVGPGDFDGDGRSDVLARTGGGDLILYSGNGRGGWLRGVTVGWGWQGFAGIAGVGIEPPGPPVLEPGGGDLNLDGHRDVLARDSSGRLLVYYGDGRGSWSGSAVLSTGWGTQRLLAGVGDTDGDGRDDLLTVSSSGELRLHRGAIGGFSASTLAGSGWGAAVALLPLGDLTGDRLSDLARIAPDGSVALSAGTAPGTWSPSPMTTDTGFAAYPLIFPVGDFDGDGRADLMGRASSGLLFLFSGQGGGAFAAARQIGNGWGGFTSLHSPGDFDGDGANDVIARASDGTLLLYSGNGSGGWKSGRAIGWGWSIFTWIG